MSAFVTKQVNRLNWKLLLANAALLVGVAFALVAGKDYLYNAFRGPFPVDKAYLIDAITRPDPLKQYLVVNFGEIHDTGFWWEETDHGVKTRYPYAAARVNGRLLLIERREHDHSTVLAGRLRHVNDKEFQKIIQGIENAQPRLRGKLPPYLFDAHTNHFSAAYALCGFCGLLSVLGIWNVIKALGRIADPRQHPVYRQLARIGNVDELAAQIDSEMMGQVKRLGPCRFTQNWLLHQSAFRLVVMRVEDIVWLHKKVVRHYHNGIPTGKTYAAVFRDRHGTTINVPSREANVDQLLSAMSHRAPWAFVGFLAQTLAAWKSNRAALVAACDQRRRTITAPPAMAA